MLGPLLLLTLLGVTLGQTSIQSSCLTVNGESVCYYLYDAGSNKVPYDNNLCSTSDHPEGSLATVENYEVLDLLRTLTSLMASGELMWIAGEKHPDDIYFRTKTGRILPINDWEKSTEVELSDHLCASVDDDSTWTTQSCDTSSDTLKYYLCQDKTDACPSEDVCDPTMPYERNLEEWCFWPYDLRHVDHHRVQPDQAAFFYCRDLGGYVMSMHNQAELAIVDGIVASPLLQGAVNEAYDEDFSLHLTMVGYNYRWRNGYAAVGLKELGMTSGSNDKVFIDRFGGFKNSLVMVLKDDPLVRDYLKFGTGWLNLLCEAIREESLPLCYYQKHFPVDLCLHHAYKAPNAVMSSNLTHLLYECENGHQFEDGTNTKIFDCSCDFDAVANITRDLTCEATPYCESQLQELGAVCECPPGETWDESGLECEDIDECELYNGGCDQICENTDGSFRCGCFAGFKTHPNVTTSCIDVDECHDTDHGCPDDSLCVNTPGSFDCVCQRGFELNDATGMCDDVNECETPDICEDNSHCINWSGSFSCECEPGYHPTDNKRCIDVDECSLERRPCSHNCTNKDGGFDCSCPTGYELDTNFRTTCIDINECKIDYGSCLGNQRCENTPGSFQCECNDGFRLDEHGVCSDIDECKIDYGSCLGNQRCENTPGNFQCECNDGFRLDENGVCSDIDECKMNTDVCSDYQRCENMPGSFQCECHNGFYMDASGDCSDIDECSQDPGPCGGDEECSNEVGSFICHCGEGKLRRSNGACVYPYSTSDMVFMFRMNGPFHVDYENKNSEKFKSMFFAIEQQFFLTVKKLVIESSFRLELRPGSVVAEVTLGLPFAPDLDLTKNVILAVWRAMKANNLLLYLEGQTLPLTEQLSYITPLFAGTLDLTDVCSIYDSLDYCLKGGECQTLSQDQPSCRCQPGFSGKRCDEEVKTEPSVWNWLTIMLLVLVIVSPFLTFLLIGWCFLRRGGGNPPGMTVPQTPRRYAPWNPYRPPVGAPHGFPPTRMPMPMRRALPGAFQKRFN